MIRFTFKKGLRFLEGTRVFTLIERLVNNKIRIEGACGERQDLTLGEINQHWLGGKWLIDETSLSAARCPFHQVTPRDIGSLSETQRAAVRRMADYLRAVETAFAKAGGRVVSTRGTLASAIGLVAAERMDRNPPSPVTLWRWWKRFNSSRCISKLVDRRSHSGRVRSKTLLSLFEEAVAEVFLTKQKHPCKAVYDEVKTKVLRLNRGLPEEDRLPPPKRATIYRWLNDLHYGLVKRARDGKAATERELRIALEGVSVTHILERIEIDHTPLDLHVIDKVTRLLLGRPWITLAIDRHSRCVIGFYVSFHSPSASSVLYCLKRAMLPKDLILSRFPDVHSPWPCRGVPDLVVCDNGMELHANAVEAVCYDMGIELQYCGVAMPEMKGAVERLFRTLSEDLIHRLPGTVFSSMGKRGDYPSEAEAAIDLETLVHLLVKWIVDKYHNTPHRGLRGKTPLQAWQDGEERRLVEMPASLQQLDTICGASATRTIFHYGVEVDNLKYNSPLLQAILQRRQKRPEVLVRFFDDDVSCVSVLDPDTGEFVRVPAANQRYARGLIRDVHRLVVAEARKRFGDEWREEQLLEVKDEIQAIVDRALAAKKTQTRKKAASVLQQDSERIFQDADALAIAQTPIDPSRPHVEPMPPGLDDDLPDFAETQRTLTEATP